VNAGAALAAILLTGWFAPFAGAFDGLRARRDLAELVRSDAASRADGIAQRLRQAGFVTARDSREPGVVNVIGERRGAADELVIFATHYDARGAPAANEAASGPAVLLEAARALAAEPLERTLWLVFFDGHERDLAGSRALAARLEREGRLASVHALVVVERVGDTDLRLETSALASPRLRALAFAAAPDLVEPRALAHFDGDHVPFLRKGVREVLPLADLRYGPGEPPGAWTDTPADDLGHVSAASLARAGALVVELARALATRSPTASRGASPRR
jgi:Zn-dependent M28 family amino/carboxypeptidase